MKLGNAFTKADFDKSVLISVYKTYRPNINVYNSKGTPNFNPANIVPHEPQLRR